MHVNVNVNVNVPLYIFLFFLCMIRRNETLDDVSKIQMIQMPCLLIQYNTIQRNAIQHNIILYNILQLHAEDFMAKQLIITW